MKNSSDIWDVTRYVYDSAMAVPQVLTETTSNGTTISYEYGLERIAAYSADTKTSYIHDAGGSVIQTVSENSIKNYSYTPFGEQLSEAVSGFGYNAEWYDAATGMQYLRARFYEPQMMRFSQQDLVRGTLSEPLSLNRYLYVQNNPVLYSDPSGMVASAAFSSTAISVGASVKNVAAIKAANVSKSANSAVKSAAQSPVKNAVNAAKNALLQVFGKSNAASNKKPSVSTAACKKSAEKASIFSHHPSLIEALPIETRKFDGLVIYHTEKQGGYEDLQCSDLSYEDLLHMKYISKSDLNRSSKNHLARLKSLAKTVSVGELRSVALDMVDHFYYGNEEPFSDPLLTQHVKNHSNTITYVDYCVQLVEQILAENNGNVYILEYAEENRDSSLFVMNMLADNIYSPSYGRDLFDKSIYTGLAFCIHGWTSVEIMISSYEFDGNTFSGTLKLTFVDNFGLDAEDIVEDGFGIFAGFKSWYILQHYDKYEKSYKPFETVVEIYEDFEGTVNGGDNK